MLEQMGSVQGWCGVAPGGGSPGRGTEPGAAGPPLPGLLGVSDGLLAAHPAGPGPQPALPLPLPPEGPHVGCGHLGHLSGTRGTGSRPGTRPSPADQDTASPGVCHCSLHVGPWLANTPHTRQGTALTRARHPGLPHSFSRVHTVPASQASNPIPAVRGAPAARLARQPPGFLLSGAKMCSMSKEGPPEGWVSGTQSGDKLGSHTGRRKQGREGDPSASVNGGTNLVGQGHCPFCVFQMLATVALGQAGLAAVLGWTCGTSSRLWHAIGLHRGL